MTFGPMFKSFRAALVPCFDLLGRQTERTSSKILAKLTTGIQNACASSHPAKKTGEPKGLQPSSNTKAILKLSKFYTFEWTSVVSVGLAEEHRHFLSVPILETAARFLSRKTVSTNSRFLAPAVRQKKSLKVPSMLWSSVWGHRIICCRKG